MAVIKIYRVLDKELNIVEDKELTRYTISISNSKFENLKVGDSFWVHIATDMRCLGEILDIQEYEYRKKKCFKVITNDKDYVVKVID